MQFVLLLHFILQMLQLCEYVMGGLTGVTLLFGCSAGYLSLQGECEDPVFLRHVC